MSETTYKIVGPLPVAGQTFGQVLTEEDLSEYNVQHLIDAGHIAVNKKGREATTETPEKEK